MTRETHELIHKSEKWLLLINWIRKGAGHQWRQDTQCIFWFSTLKTLLFAVGAPSNRRTRTIRIGQDLKQTFAKCMSFYIETHERCYFTVCIHRVSLVVFFTSVHTALLFFFFQRSFGFCLILPYRYSLWSNEWLVFIDTIVSALTPATRIVLVHVFVFICKLPLY